MMECGDFEVEVVFGDGMAVVEDKAREGKKGDGDLMSFYFGDLKHVILK